MNAIGLSVVLPSVVMVTVFPLAVALWPIWVEPSNKVTVAPEITPATTNCSSFATVELLKFVTPSLLEAPLSDAAASVTPLGESGN